MARRVFHVEGYTQYMGTCKFHLFRDCPQLTKKRMACGKWDRTGCTHEDTYDVKPYQICKLCQRREAKS